MQAIRKIRTVKNKKITIELPEDFEKQKVEVIILPINIERSKSKNLKTLLLNGPTLCEEELEEFNKTRKWMNQWEIKEF